MDGIMADSGLVPAFRLASYRLWIHFPLGCEAEHKKQRKVSRVIDGVTYHAEITYSCATGTGGHIYQTYHSGPLKGLDQEHCYCWQGKSINDYKRSKNLVGYMTFQIKIGVGKFSPHEIELRESVRGLGSRVYMKPRAVPTVEVKERSYSLPTRGSGRDDSLFHVAFDELSRAAETIEVDARDEHTGGRLPMHLQPRGERRTLARELARVERQRQRDHDKLDREHREGSWGDFRTLEEVADELHIIPEPKEDEYERA
jgi:hypothetical protein